MEAVVNRLRLDTLGAAFARTLRAHRWPVGLILGFLICGYAFTAALGRPRAFNLGLYNHALMILLGTAATLFLLGYVFYVMIYVRPERLTAYLCSDFPARFGQPERLFGLGLVLLILPVYLSGISSLKTLIPTVQPFVWDPAFVEVDRWLHGGHDPWRLLQPILGSPGATYLVNVLYNIWFFICYGVILWQAASHSLSARRLQFFIAFILCWALLGTVAAMGLSSAGPVFFGRLFGQPDPYAPLMDYLYQANDLFEVWALHAQGLVWESYRSGYQIPGGGISAMPSLHVAMAWLFALTAWQHNRKLGVAFVAYAAVIQTGSVHLAWHYAIDGYFSILATTLIWWVAGRIARRELPDSALDEGKAG
ncbi:MAG: phosphatase PAP2 family protein [Kiloniellales bacterium]